MQTCIDCLYYEACNNVLQTAFKDFTNYIFLKACELFKNKADYEEVKHGEWIEITDNVYFCSKCHRTICLGGMSIDFFPYCHCGAKMDGGKTE